MSYGLLSDMQCFLNCARRSSMRLPMICAPLRIVSTPLRIMVLLTVLPIRVWHI